MSNHNSVRSSRDGDQFHYLWAARRCLRLLSPTDGLVAISIEDSSANEIPSAKALKAGVDQIDVAEYYSSEDARKATLIRYIQLKHSTQNPTVPWPPSGLKKTISGFAKRFIELTEHFADDSPHERLEFLFISNRPINPQFTKTIEDVASGGKARYPRILRKLEEFTSLHGERLQAFCRLLALEGGHDDYWFQRADLVLETKGYLAGDDIFAPVQLKELVTRKATSAGANNPSITKIDVLRALGTTEDGMFPAPSLIASIEHTIARADEIDLVTRIVNTDAPVVFHAESGVGKSIFSQRVALHLPLDSTAVVYDCFANGEYRRAGSPRHRHKDALVQIANELASIGLCDPLIPSSNADKTDYLRAFNHRVRQSITSIRGKNTKALLCLIVDAADNAEIAAKEFSDGNSFVRDLLREPLPSGVRLVVFCRTERQALLDLPESSIRITMKPFTRKETATFLRHTYPDVLENDITEFHRLTSQNPRVQATVLAQSNSLLEVLRSLGPNPMTVDDTISALLRLAIDKLRETVGPTEQSEINAICTGLSVLRPVVPVTVLAAVANVEVAAVKSFANDLGRPLLVLEDSVQFRDEPVETWFRENFRPEAEQLSDFIQRLQSFASSSAYVASTLPQLMLEAGQLDELIELALSSSSLPTTNPIERRDVELQRLQFSLKASIQNKRFQDAAKLALKAAEETAGESRQQKLLQENTDLCAALLVPERIQEIVSRRTLSGGWRGSHYAYEAGVFSYVPAFLGDARSRLRMAYEWVENFSRVPEIERKEEQIIDDDIAEMVMARFNVDGPDGCTAELQRWTPRVVSYRVGCLIARRLVDHGRYDDLDRLAIAAGTNLYLSLAINGELRAVHRSPPKETVEYALCQMPMGCEGVGLQAIVALVESAYVCGLRSRAELASVLHDALPEEPPNRWYERPARHDTLFRAYALRAELRGENLELVDLAPVEFRDWFEGKATQQDSHAFREFKGDIGVLLPWHKLWAKSFLGSREPADLTASAKKTQQESLEAARATYREESFASDEIATIWFDIVVFSLGKNQQAILRDFWTWATGLTRPLFTPTWSELARLSARTPRLAHCAYDFSQSAFELMRNAKEDAESKAETYVELARAILGTDEAEARAYFNHAIEVASKVGDEIRDRWSAMIDLAERAADPSRPDSRAAYEFSRRAEIAQEHTYEHFDWQGTVKAIAGLCPSSCFAILSRWRDRNLGQADGLIVTAIDVLGDHGCIDPKTSLAFVGFRARWKYSSLLKRAFAASTCQSDRESILNYVLRYARLTEQSSLVWKRIKAITGTNSLTIPDIDHLIEFSQTKEAAVARAHNVNNYTKPYADNEIEWDAMFAAVDLHTAEGLSRTYDKFMLSEPPRYRELYFSELFNHIPTGREPELIRAFSESGRFDVYDVKDFLEQIPEHWRTRMAIKRSLIEAVRKLYSRHCMDINRNRTTKFSLYNRRQTFLACQKQN